MITAFLIFVGLVWFVGVLYSFATYYVCCEKIQPTKWMLVSLASWFGVSYSLSIAYMRDAESGEFPKELMNCPINSIQKQTLDDMTLAELRAEYKKCDRQECKAANRCTESDRAQCPSYPGAPTYPTATPPELRTRGL